MLQHAILGNFFLKAEIYQGLLAAMPVGVFQLDTRNNPVN